VANSEQELNVWIEGLNCLLHPQKAVQEAHMKTEIETLLNLEVRVRLLDVPQPPSDVAFKVPPLPTDFSWIPEKYRI